MLRNLVVTLTSSNPKVTPVAPLLASIPALNHGVATSVAGGLAATLSPDIADGEPLGLSLRIQHDGGVVVMPLRLYAVQTVRADVELGFEPGMLLSDPSRNRVYMVDKTNNRILSIDTQAGRVAAVGKLAGSVLIGGIALSADGKRLVVALNGSNQLQILSTDTLESMDVLHLDFRPANVAMGANGRIYVCPHSTTRNWIREIDLDSGQVNELRAASYRTSLLKTSADHRRLYVFDLSTIGGTMYLHEYVVDGGTPTARSGRFPFNADNTKDMALDEEMRRIYIAAGGTYGIQVTEMDNGLSAPFWPFDAPYGAGVAFLPGSDFVYGGSGAGDGRIRRFERTTGRPIADFSLRAPGVTDNRYLLDRGMAITRNTRLVFTTSDINFDSLTRRYFLTLIGRDGLDMTIPRFKPKLDAGTNRKVKLSKPLRVAAVSEFPETENEPVIGWKLMKGSGSAVFSMSGAVADISFSEPGRYELEISAAAEDLAATDRLWVDVEPDAPKINISPLATKAMRHPGLRAGFILSREGDTSAPLTVQLQRSGTAVVGTDFNALPATAVMATGVSTVEIPLVLPMGGAGGTVTLTVLAGTGYETGASSQAQIEIVPASFANWLQAAGDIQPGPVVTANGDPNGNGLDNRMEYLLGRNPFDPRQGNPLQLTGSGNPASMTASFRALKNPEGAVLLVEFSPDLIAWDVNLQGSPSVEILNREDHGDGTETITLRLSAEARQQPKGFLRLGAHEVAE